jgi:hypothetical protein
MAIKPDMKYSGKVGEGSYFAYSSNGNLGFYVALDCDDGHTFFTLWLTDRNREKATNTLVNVLGANRDKLSNQSYLEYELASVIVGTPVTFGTREEEYNGKTSVKVSWIGKPTDPNVSRGAAKFFGGNQNDEIPPPINESDIPF